MTIVNYQGNVIVFYRKTGSGWSMYSIDTPAIEQLSEKCSSEAPPVPTNSMFLDLDNRNCEALLSLDLEPINGMQVEIGWSLRC